LNITPPSPIDFGSVKVGHHKSFIFKLTNSAQEGPPITFQSPVGFMVTVSKPQVFGFAGSASDCHQQLLPQQTCTLTVEFIPAAPKSYSAVLTIYDNAANAKPITSGGLGEMIQLMGTGKK
jgi:hypothetical protein